MEQGWRRALRPVLTAQVSAVVSMLIGDTACQYIAKGRPTAATSIAPTTPLAAPTPSVTPLLATSPLDTDSADGLTLTVPPPPLSSSLATAVLPQPLPVEDPLPSSPLPDVRYLSAHLPHWLDPQRSLVMFTTGLLVSGPWSALTFTGLEYLFPGRSPRAIVGKVLLSAGTAPIGISMMFSAVKLLEGRSLADARAKVEESLLRTWFTGATYWPFISVLNFRFVPFEWRPLFSGMAGAAWQTYMSAQAHKPVGAAASEAGQGAESSAVVAEKVVPMPTGTVGIVEVRDEAK